MPPAKPFFVGSDFSFNVHGITAMFRSFRVTASSEIASVKPLELKTTFKSFAGKDVRILVVYYDSLRSGGGAFKEVLKAWHDESPLSDIAWNNKGVTPESQLPDEFFDDDWFPLLSWRITDVEGGPEGQNDAMAGSITLQPGF